MFIQRTGVIYDKLLGNHLPHKINIILLIVYLQFNHYYYYYYYYYNHVHVINF